MANLKRWNVGLIACLLTLCLFLTACPAPGDGTVDGGEAPAVTEDSLDPLEGTDEVEGND